MGVASPGVRQSVMRVGGLADFAIRGLKGRLIGAGIVAAGLLRVSGSLTRAAAAIMLGVSLMLVRRVALMGSAVRGMTAPTFVSWLCLIGGECRIHD